MKNAELSGQPGEEAVVLDDESIIRLETAQADTNDTETDEDGLKLRKFNQKHMRMALTLFAISMSLYHVYALFFTLSNPLATYATHWCFGMTLIFFFYPAAKKSNIYKMPVIDILIVLVIIAIGVYIRMDPNGLTYRSAYFKPVFWDVLFGVAAIVVSLEAGRRTIGLGLPIVALVLVFYALWGNIIPGSWGSKGFSLRRLVSYLFGLEGLFGTPIKMSTENIFLLILFGAFLHICGTGNMFMRLAGSLVGNRRGGPAKVAVVGSGMFGSISGSAVANVVSTGIFTIPLMKKTGYRPEFAGAVEAVASTGGQIVPPIMGSGAFIMAELLGVSYGSIAIAAVVPALLYYAGVYIAVDLEAARTNLKRMDTSTLESAASILKNGWYQFLPILVIVFVLSVLMRTVISAAIWGIVSAIVASAINKATRMSGKDILRALELGAMRAMSIVAACACAGIAIGAIMSTGLGLKFTILVTKLGGSSLLLSLVLSALAATILGMGLPTVAAYIISAAVLAGSLTALGVPPLAAHFFLFYYSLLSQITPPVALAAYAAGNIANADPMKVGFLACRLGAMAFILPFFIVYGPALILIGTWQEIVLAIITSFIGVFCFTAGQFGWLAGGHINVFSRILLVVCSLCLIIPGMTSDIIGALGIGIGLMTHAPIRRKAMRLFGANRASIE